MQYTDITSRALTYLLRSPHLHIDMTEAIYRGLAEICCAQPDGRLLAEEVIQTEERNRILHFCMGEMNPDYREVLYLTYFEGMSYAQAAEVTGKTVKQITNMVYRGKESLRRLLEQEGITNAES